MTIERKQLLKKLTYRSINRGCKELDFIIGRFSEKFLKKLSIQELMQYSMLLDLDDHLIYSWILEKEAIPQEFDHPLIRKFIAFAGIHDDSIRLNHNQGNRDGR